MKYLLLIYGNEAVAATMTEAERGTELQEYNDFTAEVNKRGYFVAGEALYPTSAATTVRVRDGKAVTTDGPFAETHEQLGGFYLVNCKDLDEATAIAAKLPNWRGSVEIRPVVSFD